MRAGCEKFISLPLCGRHDILDGQAVTRGPRTTNLISVADWAGALPTQPNHGWAWTNLSIYVVAIAVRHCDSANSSLIHRSWLWQPAGVREMDNDAIVSLPRIGCCLFSQLEILFGNI